jgi:ATP phosphoribosyltransferase regulatory subunit
MNKGLLHTPEGVRDIYNKECEQKLYLQGKIHSTFKSYGYSDIQTPTFEFLEMFNRGKGSFDSKNMYKFFDREGNTLVLRPDITPSVARAVSKYFQDEDMPLRFCYMGNTYINNAEHQGKLKEVTQLGAELVGDNTSDADVEAIALVINSLLECGLEKFLIEIGHTEVLGGLMEEASLTEEEEDSLKELLENKNFFGVSELIDKTNMDTELKNFFLKLSQLVGSIEVITEARKLISNKKILAALDRMEKVYNMLSYYGYEKYISFDLGTVGNHKYYTGLIFKGYTYGTGNAIVTGGRYDKLLHFYGKNSPSMGFAINLDQLLIAINRQKIEIPSERKKTLLIYTEENRKNAVNLAMELRRDGMETTLIRKKSDREISEYENFAKRNDIDNVMYISGTNIIEKL